MIRACHVIGLRAIELGRLSDRETAQNQKNEIIADLEKRFRQIQGQGYIAARRHRPQAWDAPGRSTWEDDLAGDDQYVFLSVGSRYQSQIPESSFGFVFDAEQLIEQGAILGLHDLASDYTEIIGEVAERVAETLPRLPRISDEELAEFAEAMGIQDQGMLEFIAENSTNPESELLEALREGDEDFLGYEKAIRQIKSEIDGLHHKKRLSGQAALNYLIAGDWQEGTPEILVKDRLDLSLAAEIIHPKHLD